MRVHYRAGFFSRGLRFACQRCGACCTGVSGTVYVGSQEIDTIADHLKIQTDAFIEHYLYPFRDSYSVRESGNGACLLFDNGCTIYPVRPMQCRTFPFWFRNLRSESRWHEIERQCPGIGQGRRHGPYEIMALARKTIKI